MAERFVFAADIGGTTVKLGLFRADGTLLEKWEIPTRTRNGGADILPDTAAAIQKKMDALSISPDMVTGIGVGVPGPVDDCNTVHSCDNLGWGRFNIKDALNSLLPGIPNVVAANDANTAALGEALWGSGKGYANTVMFTLGTGVGGGVVVNGRIVSGFNGAAGELGHFTVEPNETAVCGCGKRGCLEQYASATGLVRLTRLLLETSDTPSALRGMDSFAAKDVCDLARSGDALACAALDRCARYLALGLSFVSCTLDPELFIIGGGMSRAGDVLLDPVRRYYRSFAYHPCVDTPILPAVLGNDAGICGCAGLILFQSESTDC